ncbi:MAG TPA: CHASE domain-containing protein [Chthoniobacteraceae bacterium]|jgi:PAS domain S-box-containing protein|nr:CHASE domain-containing protein [Chthoniobacteraceae bacterium]
MLREFEGRESQMETQAAARERTVLLRNKIECSMEVLHSIGELCAAGADISRSRFRDFTTEALARHPEIQALSWDPCVPLAERGAFEQRARDDGIADFTFTEVGGAGRLAPAGKRASYVPIYMLEPLAKNRAALGFDLSSNPERRSALELARDTGLPRATEPLRLVQEPGSQLGFLVLRPVYRGSGGNSPDSRRAQLEGYVSAVFRIGDLVEDAFGPQARDGIISIYEKGKGKAIFELMPKGLAPAQEAFRWTEPMKIAGLDWEIEFWFPGRQSGWEPWAGLLVGLLITGLSTNYLIRGARRTAEIEWRVTERTAELSSEIAMRRNVERELRQAEQKYRGIFENAIEGIFQTAPDGHYISANPALACIYGYASPEELVAELGDIERQLYTEPSRRAEFVRLVQRDGSVADFESQVRRKDGQIIWITETARAVREPDGKVLYYEGTVQDVTERRRVHEALEIRVRERTADLGHANEALLTEIAERKRAEDAAASASKAKSAFLAHISHEIRTPLNAILGYAQILRRDRSLQPRQREAIETIASSGNHLFNLIDEVLDLSKIEAGRMELQCDDFDLIELIARLEGMFRHRCEQKRLRLIVEPPAPPVARMVCGDEGKLRQVLINLLGNAVKFTARGEVGLRVSRGADHAYRFEVADTGIGITEGEQAEIFEPFQQGHQHSCSKGGTGLGLAISDRYIQLMGGRLRVESSAGNGARFIFTLTLPESAAQGRAVVTGGGSTLRLPPGRQVTALVVDDIKENRAVLAGMLTEMGCDVLIAEGASRAIDIATQEKPDIIFMDIWMPEMNGIDATRHILRQYPKARIVAHSASAFDHEQNRYLDAGFDDFFAKPFRYERVCECLANLLEIQLVPEDPAPDDACEDGPMRAPQLPDELASRLRVAAEIHNVTELRACIDEIASLEDGRPLAERLRAWAAGYEMEKIIAAIAPQELAAATP